MLNHKKIYEKVAEKYSLIFWPEVRTPKNFTTFWLNENDWNNREPFMQIEVIPKTKQYFKTIYIMKIKDSDLIDKIINDITELYIIDQNKLENKDKHLCLDFNYNKPALIF